MKKLVVTMLSLVAVTGGVWGVENAAPQVPSGGRKEITPEVRRKIHENIMRKTGGWVVREGTGSGRCLFVDMQKTLPGESFRAAAERIGALLNCRIGYEQKDGTVTVQGAAGALKAMKAQAAIFVIDDPEYPTTLVAPEGRWAMINAAALTKDGALPPVLAKRATREAWRVFAQLLGASNASMEGGCVLESVSSLVELDALKADCFCPEPLSKISSHLRTIGVTPYERTTYRRACELGWAPPPVNEYQKAVWEQLKSDKERGPVKPLKIEYKKPQQ